MTDRTIKLELSPQEWDDLGMALMAAESYGNFLLTKSHPAGPDGYYTPEEIVRWQAILTKLQHIEHEYPMEQRLRSQRISLAFGNLSEGKP